MPAAAPVSQLSSPIYAPNITFGSGDPEGVITAAQGSIYQRTDAGALNGSAFYMKRSAGTTNAGWARLGLLGGGNLIGQKIGANMNSTADQAVSLLSGNCGLNLIEVTNASANLTLAAGGIYTGAAKSGTAIVAAAQVYSALSTSLLILPLTIAARPRITGGQVFISLTTAQGGTATADFNFYGSDYSIIL